MAEYERDGEGCDNPSVEGAVLTVREQVEGDLKEVAGTYVFFPEHVIEAVGATFIRAVLQAKMQEARVLVEKQYDYGPHNIGRPPSGIQPETALVIRINDKVQRASNLVAAGGAAANEPLADTWGDVANYGTIGNMLEQGDWPGVAARTERA